MGKRMLLLIAAVTLLAVTLTGCLPGDGASSLSKPAGFLWGVWHGWIAPISLVIGIFKRDIHIYESMNVGFWYDLGFYMAVVGGFGGLTFARGRNSRR